MEIQSSDGLLWIGEVYYPTIEDYIEETRRLGACRRIPKVWPWMVPGSTKIYLAHQQHTELKQDVLPTINTLKEWKIKYLLSLAKGIVNGDVDAGSVEERWLPYLPEAMEYMKRSRQTQMIFGFYLMERLELCIDGKVDPKLQELIDKGILIPIPKTVWIAESARKCGTRRVGIYAVSKDSLEFLLDKPEVFINAGIDPKKVSIAGPLILFNTPASVEAFTPGRYPGRGITRLTEDESIALAAHVMLAGSEERK